MANLEDRKLRVEDYMIHEVVSIPGDFTVQEAIDKLIHTEFHGMPVTQTGRLIGFVTAKELLRNISRPQAKVKDIIRKGTYSVSPDMDLDDAARILFRYGLRNIPVIDSHGIVIGILSNVDVVRSHIERATPNKVLMVKAFLEKKNGISITVKRRIIPIDELRPTQNEVFADELLGRVEEIKRGLVEPIIVVQKGDHYLLVDGHHRVLAARQMGVKQFSAVVLEPDREVELGLERTAKEMGLKTMEDVKIIDKSHHPLMEITTRLLKE
jgi:CBS domain-containing protein